MTQTGGMRPAGVHHVSINVRDVSAARDFYVGVLGLTERADRPDFSFDGAWLDAGSQQLHLIKADVPPDRGQHFALAVTDLDAAVAELRGHGVTVTDPVPVGAGRQSFLCDPAGNRIELQEPLPHPGSPGVTRSASARSSGTTGRRTGPDRPAPAAPRRR
jgi:glyoxylase I family protein